MVAFQTKPHRLLDNADNFHRLGTDRFYVALIHLAAADSSNRIYAVGSKLKCPVFVASEMSGFKVVPSSIGWG
jgi:hypothetical protein